MPIHQLGRPPARVNADRPEHVVESAARSHRADGPRYWEGFTAALLSCFEVADLQHQAWLPVGTDDLAAPSQRVFLNGWLAHRIGNVPRSKCVP